MCSSTFERTRETSEARKKRSPVLVFSANNKAQLQRVQTKMLQYVSRPVNVSSSIIHHVIFAVEPLTRSCGMNSRVERTFLMIAHLAHAWMTSSIAAFRPFQESFPLVHCTRVRQSCTVTWPGSNANPAQAIAQSRRVT